LKTGFSGFSAANDAILLSILILFLIGDEKDQEQDQSRKASSPR
jgi:hypothetical protein